MNKNIGKGLLGIILGFSLFSFWARTSFCEEDIYTKMVYIGGIVTTTEIETKEESKALNKFILFQRMDCKKCVSAFQTDSDGKYKALLGEGKYQIIVRECGKSKNIDCIDPKQTRIVSITTKGNHQFDVKLIHKKEDSIIEIPNNLNAP